MNRGGEDGWWIKYSGYATTVMALVGGMVISSYFRQIERREELMNVITRDVTEMRISVGEATADMRLLRESSKRNEDAIEKLRRRVLSLEKGDR